ncbi:DeoR/GlpR family DNA-binding transcription regulator [Pleomorphochaeta sp. DL1XJH-081]|uniref:DeoR/GlpR family DNA-binding transcription regulator n=1 Tax=Pleomorphochaeta sp. DL1XJH-081 TaxID=3409690 RepID=UPI003BB5FE68
MLSETRYAKILSILKDNQSATVKELAEILEASESTIRRDLNTLHKRKKLEKVFGGAVINSSTFIHTEDKIEAKKKKNIDEKNLIASYAASLIEDGDCVYIDAGSTTELIIDHIQADQALFVTNCPGHNRKLSLQGFNCILLGGELRLLTDALVGCYALESLQRFNFNKGFFGTNGISIESGFTTSFPTEASIKSAAIERCNKAFVLADASKFGSIAAITFADIYSVSIITRHLKDKRYLDHADIFQIEEMP